MRRVLTGVVLAMIAGVPLARATDQQSSEQIARGRYLATVGDCTACHTASGGQPFAGGKPIETPFGKLVTPNITPDVATGIGAWTDDDFYRAMHTGVAANGMHLYPAFPYTAFTHVTRADVLAIRAWLATLPPVRNKVQVNTLPFPFDVRASLIGWDALFFKPGTYAVDHSRSVEWNRGAYLVQGLGHCGACHTPRNTLGAEENSRLVQGGPLQGWYAPNLTGSAWNGLGGWSVDDVVSYLKTGANPHQLASGPMAEVITDSTSHWNEADLRAVAVYLKDLPPPSRPAKPQPVAAGDAPMQRGAAIYADECSACHTPNGAGISHLFPQLAGSPAVQQRGPQALAHVVLAGAKAVSTEGAVTGPAMPPFYWKLDDRQVADVLTYIRNAWGNAAPAVSVDEVASARERTKQPQP